MVIIRQITLEGVNFDVHFSYVPAEPQTYDHPGYDEELEITDIFLAGTDYEWITYFNEDAMDYFLEEIKNAR